MHICLSARFSLLRYDSCRLKNVMTSSMIYSITSLPVTSILLKDATNWHRRVSSHQSFSANMNIPKLYEDCRFSNKLFYDAWCFIYKLKMRIVIQWNINLGTVVFHLDSFANKWLQTHVVWPIMQTRRIINSTSRLYWKLWVQYFLL